MSTDDVLNDVIKNVPRTAEQKASRLRSLYGPLGPLSLTRDDMATKSTTSMRKLTELLDPKFMARLDALDVISRKILQGKLQGERRSKRRGQSVEFADHRPYVVGDDLRFVDWNVYGRLDQLFLKLFLEEQDLTVHILADASASMSVGDPSKDLFTKRLTAALGYIGLVNNNRVTISLFADGVRMQLANMRGRNYLPQMAELLLTTECDGFSDFEKACRDVAAGRIGSGITIVISDFLFKQGYEAALRRLLGARYDLYVIQVLSPAGDFTGAGRGPEAARHRGRRCGGDHRQLGADQVLQAESGGLLQGAARLLHASRGGVRAGELRRFRRGAGLELPAADSTAALM